ncbi:MAG TPA: nucleotidyltransferase family protein [Burkholderiales bacterium]|nr:nucleotidyltransferase family protein [Burkholderiales bacterium]
MPRPRTGKALSAAERMRRYRVRRRSAGLRSVSAWTPRWAREQLLAKADLIRSLAKAHGAVSIELFGSAARGEDRPDSDLDLMVELEPGRSLLDLIGLSQDLEMALNRKVEAVSKAALKPRVLAQARKEAVKLV